MSHFFYFARCKDDSLYAGVSLHPGERVKEHNKGKGSLWIKQHGPAQIVYREEYETLPEARKREAQIKKWSRSKKEKLIRGELNHD